MRLTPRYVGALHMLKRHGYERVAIWVGSYYSTTYVNIYPIDDLIKFAQTYISIRAERPVVRKGMWRGHANTRDLTAKDVRASRVIKLAEEVAKREDDSLTLGNCKIMQDELNKLAERYGHQRQIR
jgi:hypothetical protein